MKVIFNPSYVDIQVLKSLSKNDLEDLLKKGLDVEKLEQSLVQDMKKANPVAGQPVAGREIDRTNLVPVKKTITRNGRQQLTTVWVNPNNNESENEEQQSKQPQDENATVGSDNKDYISPDGVKVSMKKTGNSDYPFTVTVTDKTGNQQVKRITTQKLAEQEVKNLVGNLDEASDRANGNNSQS